MVLIKEVKEVTLKVRTTAATSTMRNKGEHCLCRGKKEKEGTCHKLRTRGTPSTSALCIPWLRNSARLEKAERATHAGIFAFVRRSQDCAQHFAFPDNWLRFKGRWNSNRTARREKGKKRNRKRGYATPIPATSRAEQGHRRQERRITSITTRRRAKGERCRERMEGGRKT